ncbi:MAG TPA: VOC family protein [Rhizomicrobium sp.]|nr:VOC family protein [Rhizomicrobium sp.]
MAAAPLAMAPTSVQAMPAQVAHPLLNGVAQVSLVTHDLPRAKAFYRNVLGLDFLFESNGLAFFRAGEMTVMVGAPSNEQMISGGSTTVYFDAGDWNATEATLLARGVQFIAPVEIVERDSAREHALREFTDPDGNHLAIIGWRPRTS